MERSLDSIVEEIAQNDEMSREFAAMDEKDEIYTYCKNAGLCCSEEEFDNEIMALINDFENSDPEKSEYMFENIAGGIKNFSDSCKNGRTIGQLLLQGRR